MSHQNRETLKRALDSLKKEEEVEWKENLYFIPSATNGLQEMELKVTAAAFFAVQVVQENFRQTKICQLQNKSKKQNYSFRIK